MEKTARQEPVVKLILEDGVTFVRSLTSRQYRWQSPAMLPIFLIYIQNCFADTVYELGYRSFLCHPSVVAAEVTLKVSWFFCSLIDFLYKHLCLMTITDHYLRTPKQPGTYLKYLTDIYEQFVRSRFTDPTADDLVKQVVSHFFSSLSLDEKQKLREVSTSFERCQTSYAFLRSELERTQISFVALPKLHAAQHHTGGMDTNSMGKRKRDQAPEPEHGVICSDPTLCEPCKNWVINIFSFVGYCLRCFGKGHNYYDCYQPIALKNYRCMYCTRLCCAPFSGNHTRCKDFHKNTKCHCCGLLGHMGSVCQSDEAARKAHRLVAKS
jgi:hypothetical protein